MKLVATDQKVQIKWFVYAGEEMISYNSTMRGTWGWDATCSCGWATKTGGAIRSSVLAEVQNHKRFDHNYSYKVGS
jgi:hypothetical protein